MSRERAKTFGFRIVGVILVGLLPVLIPAWPAHAEDEILPDEQSIADNLYFEPIEGLTTVRHLAPRQTAIPLGLLLRLFLQAPPDAQVSITGAIVLGRNPDGVSAVCPLNQVGPLTIRGVVQMPDGTTKTSTCKLNVVAIPISEIAVTAVTPSVAPFDLGENATNEQTMALFFGESIAALRPVATWGVMSESGDAAPRRMRGQATTSRYLTSIDRTIRMVAEVNHADFKPLMEWRVNGAAFALGSETDRAFYHTGTHSIEVGPPARAAQLRFDTYSVSIVSHRSGVDFIAEGEPIMYEAVTDPHGYADGITWLSSTKAGTADPVFGRGRTFTVQFDDTFGDDPVNGYFQWLGVKADNARFNQDETTTLVCGVRGEGGLMVAFIGLSDGADFVSVGFDPVTFEEDFATQRFFGLNEMELEALEDIGNTSLLTHPLAAPAGVLWETGLPCAGTAEELALLSRQSQLLIIMLDSIGASNLQRENAGCTLVPDFNFSDCCDAHDLCYAAGGTSADRKICDQDLRDWIINVRGRPILGRVYYWGVRAFGWLFF